jgi:hypothetical protein
VQKGEEESVDEEAEHELKDEKLIYFYGPEDNLEQGKLFSRFFGFFRLFFGVRRLFEHSEQSYQRLTAAQSSVGLFTRVHCYFACSTFLSIQMSRIRPFAF